MEYPDLYRKRIIPEECILLKDDEILFLNDDLLVTRWKTLKPRKDFHHGVSCYFLKEGFKISKFYREDESLLYWYCDIISADISKDANKIVITDLLADVVILPDGFVRVLDLEELSEAHAAGKLSTEMLTQAVALLGKLLKIIYNGAFGKLALELEQRE